jgi:hypothetical protein
VSCVSLGQSLRAFATTTVVSSLAHCPTLLPHCSRHLPHSSLPVPCLALHLLSSSSLSNARPDIRMFPVEPNPLPLPSNPRPLPSTPCTPLTLDPSNRPTSSVTCNLPVAPAGEPESEGEGGDQRAALQGFRGGLPHAHHLHRTHPQR